MILILLPPPVRTGKTGPVFQLLRALAATQKESRRKPCLYLLGEQQK